MSKKISQQITAKIEKLVIQNDETWPYKNLKFPGLRRSHKNAWSTRKILKWGGHRWGRTSKGASDPVKWMYLEAWKVYVNQAERWGGRCPERKWRKEYRAYCMKMFGETLRHAGYKPGDIFMIKAGQTEGNLTQTQRSDKLDIKVWKKTDPNKRRVWKGDVVEDNWHVYYVVQRGLCDKYNIPRGVFDYGYCQGQDARALEAVAVLSQDQADPCSGGIPTLGLAMLEINPIKLSDRFRAPYRVKDPSGPEIDALKSRRALLINQEEWDKLNFKQAFARCREYKLTSFKWRGNVYGCKKKTKKRKRRRIRESTLKRIIREELAGVIAGDDKGLEDQCWLCDCSNSRFKAPYVSKVPPTRAPECPDIDTDRDGIPDGPWPQESACQFKRVKNFEQLVEEALNALASREKKRKTMICQGVIEIRGQSQVAVTSWNHAYTLARTMGVRSFIYKGMKGTGKGRREVNDEYDTGLYELDKERGMPDWPRR